MRLLVALLLVVVGCLQYRLWYGSHSIQHYLKQQEELKSYQASNVELKKRNKVLQADVADLQSGMDSIEERARNELGLIRQDEYFFRLVQGNTKR